MTIPRRHALGALLATPLVATLPALAQTSQEWPRAKPISWVVPFTPGGSTDVVGRAIAQKLGDRLGQTVVIENKPGAGGGVGAAWVAKAAPDGYTLFGGTISTHAINLSLYPDLPYHPVKDFEPVCLIAFLPNVLLVDPNLGINSVAELIELLKRDPKKRSFASSGVGTSTHLGGELFASMIGVPLTHVPYKGTPPAMIDVSSGVVTFMFDQMTAALPLLENGKLKLLAVTTQERIALAPNTPTMQEAGVTNFQMASWQAVYAPKGTPTPVLERLAREIGTIVQEDPEIQKRLGTSMGMQLVGSTPQVLRELMATEIERWAQVIKTAGVKI